MEKELIKGQFYNLKYVLCVIFALCTVPFLIATIDYMGYIHWRWIDVIVTAVVFYFPAILMFITYLIVRKCSITVTNQRVYGKAIFGQQVDLPLDSISAIKSTAFILFRNLVVTSPSGKIKFYYIKNYQEVYEVIGDLLKKRQNSLFQNQTSVIKQNFNADELKKYKELFDEGIITQEEFEAKKKQLLEL